MMEDGVAYGVQFVLTAATPRNNRNPTFRIYYLDRNTLELIDWQNYQLDLNNITGKEIFSFIFLVSEIFSYEVSQRSQTLVVDLDN